MRIDQLSDEQLHQNLLTLKSKESRIVASIVSHLEEVYRRRLFADFQCTSIYDYCIRILGYSNGDAHKKISACKLASRCKGVKEAIASGELSLSNAASVQVFLNHSAKSCQPIAGKEPHKFSESRDENTQSQGSELLGRIDKASAGDSHARHQTFKRGSSPLDPKLIIDRVKNRSTRECEVELQKIAKENKIKLPEKKPSARSCGDKTLLKIYLDREQLQLLKSRLNINCEQELLRVLLKEKLKATAPKTEIKQRLRKQSSSPKPRSISPAKRAIIFKQAKQKCENCGSKYYLQIDHKLSVFRGGGSDIENLRLLCRSCNQRAAIHQLGLPIMDQFINKGR